ncbi:IucA/IucC family protein [Actinomadura sp. NPDC047616]|uniref:IucA/IucC family protein n=1 Tax=Actinomadura sp. NPDC047616 TaxID=3155914 RepID=UPI0033CE5B82
MTEQALATRVLDTLLREDYGNLRRFIDTGQRTLALPGAPAIRLRRDRFLHDLAVEPGQPLKLDDVLRIARHVADPRDDISAFERECREALATLRLHKRARPEVMARLSRVPDEQRRGPGTYYDTLAAYNDHPVYPTGLARTGLTEEQQRQYAPEFAPSFPLRWAAIPHELTTTTGPHPSWWPTPEEVGLNADTALFPVHPLSVGHLSDHKDVTIAPHPRIEAAPTLSMRTVAVGPLTHVKMPLPTSTLGLRNRRTIVPRTLPDGALAERLLRRVLDHEPDLPVLLADEQTFGHAGSPMLGYLVRRFPEATASAHVVPVAALLARTPNGEHVIERWDVPTLFGAYLNVLLRWNVTLFRYGIALEAHQQNVSLVITGDDQPSLLLKDNDGALFDPDRLAGTLGPAAADAATGFADPRMTTRDPEALARVFVTITLHLCAAAPAFGLAERGLLPLRTGLAIIRDRLDAALGPDDAFLRSRTLDADRLPTKAMVTAGTLVDKARTGAADINKHYGPPGPNYLRDNEPCS